MGFLSLLTVLTFHPISAQVLKSKCAECQLPTAHSISDTVMDVQFRDKTLLSNCVSVKREMIEINGSKQQALRLRFLKNSTCSDTIVMAHQVEYISTGSLGLDGNPFTLQVLPAREFLSTLDTNDIPASFVELTGNLGYGGSDESSRSIGFGSMYYGGELLIAPFGTFLGRKFSLALGGGAFLEGGRMRFPAIGHLRYTLLGEAHYETVYEFVPSACQFGTSDGKHIEPGSGYTEVQSPTVTDSSVYFYRKNSIVQDDFRPYLFVEGGVVFNSSFEGNGSKPSINPDDYGQFLLGGGIGLPFATIFTASLGYRYMRLNLRTPCLTCPPAPNGNPDEFYVVNTNSVHSILLKVGLHFDW
ncbi:MAG: hypothetical protein IPM69_05255 [Ignavibacteria bacterium]|nr:hypothetical protein [Ignavibacteria bacterium]